MLMVWSLLHRAQRAADLLMTRFGRRVLRQSREQQLRGAGDLSLGWTPPERWMTLMVWGLLHWAAPKAEQAQARHPLH